MGDKDCRRIRIAIQVIDSKTGYIPESSRSITILEPTKQKITSDDAYRITLNALFHYGKRKISTPSKFYEGIQKQ